jgi:acetylornithine deacetylase
MEEKIAAKVEEKSEQIVDLLGQLVRIPSLTGEEGKGQEFVAGYLRSLGLQLDQWEPDVKELFDRYPEVAQYPTHWQHDLILPYETLPSYEALVESKKTDVLNYDGRANVVGTLKGEGGGKSLILNGHIDTVTVEPADEWTHDPFGAEIAAGTMYGRGVSDMKAGVIAGLIALECLVELRVPLRGDVIFQSVVNEEHAGNGTLSCVARGYTADAAIVMEPTKNEVWNGNTGGVYWGARLKGRPRPTGARWAGRTQQGVSAMERLPHVINHLMELERRLNAKASHPDLPEQNSLSITIGRVRGGHYDTVTASECVLNGCAYFGSEVGSVLEVMEHLRQAIARANEDDSLLKEMPAEVFFLHHDDTSEVDSDEPIIRTLVSVGEKVMGQKPSVYRGNVSCDMRHLVNQGKIPTLVFGPGSWDLIHSPDEFIPLRAMVPSIQTLALTIYEWCK